MPRGKESTLFRSRQRDRSVTVPSGEARNPPIPAFDCERVRFQSDSRIFERVQEGNLDMAITDSSHARRPSPPPKAWTIAVLAGFGILHVVGGYMLHHAPSIRPIETATTAIRGD